MNCLEVYNKVRSGEMTITQFLEYMEDVWDEAYGCGANTCAYQ